jgi:hypothetical protein
LPFIAGLAAALLLKAEIKLNEGVGTFLGLYTDAWQPLGIKGIDVCNMAYMHRDLDDYL